MSTRSEALEAMFDEVVTALRERMKDPECPPAVYQAALKVLRDNDITAIARDDSPLADLRDSLPEHLWDGLKAN